MSLESKNINRSINQLLMRQSFEQAARRYDDAAVLQREIADRLLERLDYIRFEPANILDLGSGTGYCLYKLAEQYKKASMLALDIAPAMLQWSRQKRNWRQRFSSRFQYLAGDAAKLPLADNSVDMIFSNLALQWCVDLKQVFSELRRVLKPGGMLLFSTFGPDTLKELRHCWSKVDDYKHINDFVDLHLVGDAVLQSGFENPVMDMEMITVTYQDVMGIMRDLKEIGAHNVNNERARGLMGKARLKNLAEVYELFRTDELLPVSHEVIYGHAWKPETEILNTGQCGIQEVSVESLMNSIKRD